jgi:nucleoside-diphosphate-sugar epimerase
MAQQFQDVNNALPIVSTDLSGFSLMRFFNQRIRRKKVEVRVLRWKDVLLRVTADLMLVNGSIFIAAIVWAASRGEAGSHGVVAFLTGGRTSIFTYVVLWSLLAIAVFHLQGFYTRTRGYASRYKVLVITRAVTLVAVLFVVADRFLLLGDFSRAVTLLGWALMLVSILGARSAKEFFLSTYKIESRTRPSNKVERVLVLGGAGYLGSVLMSKLLARGYKVRALDSFLFGESSIEGIKRHPDFEVVKGDIREIQPVVDAMKNCDAVIDLAAIVGDPACDENHDLAVEVNRAATRMLIDIASGYGIRRFLFASSCSVYGASDFLMDEHSQVAPISTYAQTKVDSENLLIEAGRPNFHPTILRLGTLFGLSYRPRLDLVVNLLTARAAITGKITIFNGTQWRPFLHVSDAARAFILCLEANPAVVSGEILNVGDYELNHQLMEISEKLTKVVPFVETCHVENGDKRNYRVSFDKIHSRLGFRCEKTLDEGIAEMYQWIKTNKISDVSAAQFNNQAMVRVFAQTAEAQHSTFRALEVLVRSA